MVVTNQTSVDIYFGPLHLAAGVGTTLTVDDTSATSLYLLDDAVADALNNAYLANKITVSGQALPFPRPTGDPQILHGSGSPEGSVYAPQGSSFMRRDNSGAGNALYAKTTGRTFSTGWQSFGVPVVSALSGGPPTSPLDGDIWIATAVDANGTRWAFQYNAGSSSAYKWESIGGPPTVVFVATEETGNSTTFANFSTRQNITLARAGDYLITTAADLESGVNNCNCLVAPKIGTNATAAADGIELGQWANGSLASGPRISLQKGPLPKTGIAAGTVIELQIANSDNLSVVAAKNRLLAISPVRIS